jgi:hypothetical protein
VVAFIALGCIGFYMLVGCSPDNSASQKKWGTEWTQLTEDQRAFNCLSYHYDRNVASGQELKDMMDKACHVWKG